MAKKTKMPVSEGGSQLIYDKDHQIILDDLKVCIRYDVMGRAYKKCAYCKKWKPVEEFERSSSPLSKDGYGSFCDACRPRAKKAGASVTKTHPDMPTEEPEERVAKAGKTRKASSKFDVVDEQTGKTLDRNGKPVKEEKPKSPATDDMLAGASTFALIRELERRGCKMQVSVSIPPDALVMK